MYSFKAPLADRIQSSRFQCESAHIPILFQTRTLHYTAPTKILFSNGTALDRLVCGFFVCE